MNCLFWLFLLFFCGGNNGSCGRERAVAEPAVCPPAWNNDCPCDNRSSVREDSVREDSVREDSMRRDSVRQDSRWQDSRIMPPPRNDFPGYGHNETCGCEENA